MKLFALVTACVLALGVVAVNVRAEDKAADKSTTDKPAAKEPTSKPAIVNKKCPVSGEDVDPKGKTVTYKGKTVGFCCDDCIEKFEKDPDKYAKDMK
jgi:YHS domain-containing protein